LSVALNAVVLPQRLAVAVYRITQEALTNVIRHAGATRVDIEVRVHQTEGTLSLSVIDNGRGLVADTSLAAGASAATGIGLAGIRERVLANQGRLSLEPAQPHGLALRAVFPLHTAAEDAIRAPNRDLARSDAIPMPN
jgi:signal transduction histidine kinase